MPLEKDKITLGTEIHPLNQFFLKQEKNDDFSFLLALEALEKLESSVPSEEDLNLYLLEDIIFSSIYATFYETLFIAIKNNPQVATQLIKQFEKNEEERKQIIAEQSEHHVNFVLNLGNCQGCPSCQHHRDVNELIPHWKRGNRDFFLTLYLGMQTIQFAMEHLLYKRVPHDNTLIPLLGQQDILRFRQFIYRYVESRC